MQALSRTLKRWILGKSGYDYLTQFTSKEESSDKEKTAARDPQLRDAPVIAVQAPKQG